MSMNHVVLAGIVEKEPDFLQDGIRPGKYANALEVCLKINRTDIDKVDHVSFLLAKEDLIERALNEIEVGDYLIMPIGAIKTHNYDRQWSVNCPYCNHIDYLPQNGEITDIVGYDFRVIAGADPNLPGINQVFLLGNVCKLNESNNRPTIKAKLAVNRPKKNQNQPQPFSDSSSNPSLSETEPEQNADYPFLVIRNKLAEQNEKILRTRCLLLVRGTVNQREISQPLTRNCSNPECGKPQSLGLPGTVREIIVQSMSQLTSGYPRDFPQQPEERTSWEAPEPLSQPEHPPVKSRKPV